MNMKKKATDMTIFMILIIIVSSALVSGLLFSIFKSLIIQIPYLANKYQNLSSIEMYFVLFGIITGIMFIASFIRDYYRDCLNVLKEREQYKQNKIDETPKPCSCGCSEPPSILVRSQSLYKVVCKNCNRATSHYYHSKNAAISDWNNEHDLVYIKNKYGVMDRKDILKELHSMFKNSHLTKEQIMDYFEKISVYNDYQNTALEMFTQHGCYPQYFSLSPRQESCAINAIQDLFENEFAQALRETYDVIDDYNSHRSFTYNEYMLVESILTVYNNLKSNLEDKQYKW